MPEWVFAVGLAVNTVALLVVLFKLVWGGGTALQVQFHELDKACNDQIAKLKHDWQTKFDLHTTNVGTVTMSMGDRFHRLEMLAMETRAIAAETYMRRDSYHKATDEFKRDVRDAHDDLKEQMIAGFNEVKGRIDEVSQSIEAGRRTRST